MNLEKLVYDAMKELDNSPEFFNEMIINISRSNKLVSDVAVSLLKDSIDSSKGQPVPKYTLSMLISFFQAGVNYQKEQEKVH